ncbi:MAG: PAS domain S-box protein [Methylococcaceae bacterium]|jgi:PAS domain S-box-containing protein
MSQENGEVNCQDSLHKTGALAYAALNSSNLACIATDLDGVIQIYNIGAERMLGYTSVQVLNKISLVELFDPSDILILTNSLGVEFGISLVSGFDTLVFKASRGLEDIHTLTYIHENGSRIPALVSISTLCDANGKLIGYQFIGADNSSRNQAKAEQQSLLKTQAETYKQLQQSNIALQLSEEKLAVTLNSIGDAVIATDIKAIITFLNPCAAHLTGWTQAEAIGRRIEDVFHIINKQNRQPATIPIMDALAHGTIQVLAHHTVLTARDGKAFDIADSCTPICNRDGQVIGAVLVFRDITEENTRKQALSDSAELIQTILNTVVDGIITMRSEGSIIEAINPATEQMFGYDESELIGQNLSLLIPELIPGTGINSLENYFNTEQAISFRGEVLGLRKDASRFPLEISVSGMSIGGQRYFTGILRNISARKQIEANQQQLNQRLRDLQVYTRSLFESNIDALMTTDLSGIITDVNQQMETLTGYKREELIGTSFKIYFTDPGRAQAGIDRVLDEKKITNYELIVCAQDGKKTVVSYNATPFFDGEKILQGVFAAARDVTERYRLDQVLQDKNTELVKAKSVAEKANLAKSDFLSSMSHELRTPLNAILGFAQLLASGSPAPTSTQMLRLDQIIKGGWYLLTLINEILDLALIESGKLSLSQEPLLLIDVMQECQAMMEPQAQQRDIKLVFIPFENTWHVHADRMRLKQILINLLSNAVKYNCVQGRVEVQCRISTPEYIRISIKDNGAGLSPEKLAQLFQPFNRLGQESGNEEGTGIGLIVTKQLVELMGGRIGVESHVGVGTEFWIELKLATATQVAVNKPKPTDAFESQIQNKSAIHTLLYVEDNPANLLLVEQILAEHPKLKMLSVRDGNLGIALALAHLPDVILMDVNLPGISGISALKILNEDPATKHIPIIALSANAVPRGIEKGLNAGFFRYLTKPIKVDELMSALDDALRFSQTTAIDNIETGQNND